VIDYKTDHFLPAEMPSHVSKHREQLLTYVEHIERLTKIKAKPAIYFAQQGILEEIK